MLDDNSAIFSGIIIVAVISCLLFALMAMDYKNLRDRLNYLLSKDRGMSAETAPEISTIPTNSPDHLAYEGNSNVDGQIRCPKCKSIHVHAESRGWSIWIGLLGSGRIFLTCLKCGKRFQPSHEITGY